MSKTKIEKTGELVAVGSDGKSCTVIELTTFIYVVRLHQTMGQWEPGMKAYTLANGDPVNKLSDRAFEIVANGMRLDAAGG